VAVVEKFDCMTNLMGTIFQTQKKVENMALTGALID